ncbi:MAG: NAD(P)/FAD-dependent oxidoreductase [Candidatus Dormibacteraeota bacterium]|nr:NAD(P)/FAD-dependent oxidoreductase [Candidatus Dormibacteraeota bacterium]
MSAAELDAVVVGAGPNGLAAAVLLAERGRSVLVVEAESEIGGGCRTAELTLPGFRHDVCASVLPFSEGSPFFRHMGATGAMPELIQPPAALAHPLDGGDAVLVERSVDRTAAALGADERRYRTAFDWLVRNNDAILDQFLGPLRAPRHPVSIAAFGLPSLLPARTLARVAFRTDRARALFGGMAAHSMMSLDEVASAGVGVVLGMLAHAVGWPVVRGGSAAVTTALADRLRSLGGTIETGRPVSSLAGLPSSRVVLLDLMPAAVARVCGDALPAGYRDRLLAYRLGPGVFKLDWALDGPIPWSNPGCARAATVHLGGSLDEVAASEAAVHAGHHSPRPFVILIQPSLFDDSRAPAGKHTAWAYCHVPNGSTLDRTDVIEEQVERFAPGFRDRVIGRSAMDTAAMEGHNANLVGGDINGGAFTLRQIFARPVARVSPHTTPNPRLFLCSAATPPGGGVHGMCGWWAARAAQRRLDKA